MDRRGFASVEEMNEYMIEKWNKKVRKNDDVVIIGDLSWGNVQETNTLLQRLKGKLYLVCGNHDRFVNNKEMNPDRFKWIKHYAELSDNRRKVVLCHYPIMCYNGQYRVDEKGEPKTYMLYGHVHDTQDERLIEQFQEITRKTMVTDAQGNERSIPCNMINCFCKFSDYLRWTSGLYVIRGAAAGRKRKHENQTDIADRGRRYNCIRTDGAACGRGI